MTMNPLSSLFVVVVFGHATSLGRVFLFCLGFLQIRQLSRGEIEIGKIPYVKNLSFVNKLQFGLNFNFTKQCWVVASVLRGNPFGACQ